MPPCGTRSVVTLPVCSAANSCGPPPRRTKPRRRSPVRQWLLMFMALSFSYSSSMSLPVRLFLLLSRGLEIELQRLRLVRVQRLSVAQVLLPIFQQPREAVHVGGVGRVGREVLQLGRVVPQVEELRLVHLWV